MNRLRSWMLGCTVVALVAAGAVPAHAEDDSRYLGGCVLVAATDENGVVTGPHDFTGVLVGAIVVYSPDTPSDNPVRARLRCYVKVNGSEIVSVQGENDVVVVAGPALVSFHADDQDVVEVCTEVDYLNNATATVNSCTDTSRTHVPPQEVLDLVEVILQLVDDVKRTVLDPILCPIFAALAPGVPGILDITPEGDVYLFGSKIWDCPPYDDERPVVNVEPIEVIVGADLQLEPI